MVIYNQDSPVVKANFFTLLEEKADYFLPFEEKEEIIKAIRAEGSTLY